MIVVCFFVNRMVLCRVDVVVCASARITVIDNHV